MSKPLWEGLDRVGHRVEVWAMSLGTTNAALQVEVFGPCNDLIATWPGLDQGFALRKIEGLPANMALDIWGRGSRSGSWCWVRWQDQPKGLRIFLCNPMKRKVPSADAMEAWVRDQLPRVFEYISSQMLGEAQRERERRSQQDDRVIAGCITRALQPKRQAIVLRVLEEQGMESKLGALLDELNRHLRRAMDGAKLDLEDEGAFEEALAKNGISQERAQRAFEQLRKEAKEFFQEEPLVSCDVHVATAKVLTVEY